MYTPITCPPNSPCDCESHTPNTPPCTPNPQNIINITCGSGSHHNNPCIPNPNPPTVPSTRPVCPNLENNQLELTFGNFRYIVDVLPGFIDKYQIDSSGNILPDTRVIITHNLGVLKKISANMGKIVVEDSYSIEHIATIDPVTGMLTF